MPRKISALKGFPKSRSVFTAGQRYDCVVDGYRDADTIGILADLGFGTFTGQWVRLENVWAPELNTPQGKEGARVVREELLPPGTWCRLTSTTYLQTFDRIVGSLVRLGDAPEDDLDVNRFLIEEGYATTAPFRAIVEQLYRRRIGVKE